MFPIQHWDQKMAPVPVFRIPAAFQSDPVPARGSLLQQVSASVQESVSASARESRKV